MATMNALSTFDFGELGSRCAEMAAMLRGVRAAGAAMPIVCLLDCDPQHWTAWGAEEVCTNCGTRPIAAHVWHAVLVVALRSCVAAASAERGAA